MNGMNKAIAGVVFGVALMYAALSLVLTVQNLMETGVASMYLSMPHGGKPGIDLGEHIGPVTELYDSFLRMIAGYVSEESDVVKIVELVLVLFGFVLSVAGMVSKSSLDCRGTDNLAQYIWTHRPRAAARCLAAPWGLITVCWAKAKPLVIVPIILLPFYAFWSVLITMFLIIPFAITKGVIGARISAAAKREGREYEKFTQFAVCPKCKRNFLRPKVKCRCGLDLDYPVPNEHGYKVHYCNNGHEIPCTSGKRSALRTICPYCGADIETREAMPVAVAMVGAVGAGKTTMMLAAVDTIAKMARIKDVSVEAVTPGISRQAVLAKDVAPKTAPGELDTECLFLKSKTMADRELLINDISGQEFEPREGKALFEEYYTYTDGIVFVFDPISLTRQRRGATPMDVFESFHFMFTQITGSSPNRISDVPMAVVATRNDIISPTLKDSDVRGYLVDNGQEGFVKVLESLFSDVRYFAVSSYGDDCMTAARPFWWIVSKTDPELAGAVLIEMRRNQSGHNTEPQFFFRGRNGPSGRLDEFSDDLAGGHPDFPGLFVTTFMRGVPNPRFEGEKDTADPRDGGRIVRNGSNRSRSRIVRNRMVSMVRIGVAIDTIHDTIPEPQLQDTHPFSTAENPLSVLTTGHALGFHYCVIHSPFTSEG